MENNRLMDGEAGQKPGFCRARMLGDLRALDGIHFSCELSSCPCCLSALAFRAGDMDICVGGWREIPPQLTSAPFPVVWSGWKAGQGKWELSYGAPGTSPRTQHGKEHCSPCPLLFNDSPPPFMSNWIGTKWLFLPVLVWIQKNIKVLRIIS